MTCLTSFADTIPKRFIFTSSSIQKKVHPLRLRPSQFRGFIIVGGFDFSVQRYIFTLTHPQQPPTQPTPPPSPARQSVPAHQHASFQHLRNQTHLNTSAHRKRRTNPLRPNSIHVAELLDVNNVNPPANDLVQRRARGLQARADVAHRLVLQTLSTRLAHNSDREDSSVRSALRFRHLRSSLSWGRRPSSPRRAGWSPAARRASSCRWALGRRGRGLLGACRVGTWLFAAVSSFRRFAELGCYKVPVLVNVNATWESTPRLGGVPIAEGLQFCCLRFWRSG